MTLEIGIVFAVLSVAFIIFVTGVLKPDVTALLVLISLVLTGVVTYDEVFTGFSSFAVMAIAGLLIISKALERTGVVKAVARILEKVTGKSCKKLLFINTAAPGILSGFVNIVAAASFFIPVIMRLSRKMNISPSKILLPMAYASLIGANLTLIGASHNLVVHSLLEDATGQGFKFFEFSIVGLVFLIAAILYIIFFGVKLLPERQVVEEAKKEASINLIDEYRLKNRLFEIWVTEEFDGKKYPYQDMDIDEKHGVAILEIIREGKELLFAKDNHRIMNGDMLLVQGNEYAIKEFCDNYDGLVFLGPPRAEEKFHVSSAELAEAVVPPRSKAIGKTPMEMEFRKKWGFGVLAVFRENEVTRTHAVRKKLKEGDGLLFYGPRENLRDFNPEKELLIYNKPGEPEISKSKKQYAPISAAILLTVILTAALDIIPIAVGAIAGAGLVVLAGILSPDEAYRAIDWKTIVLVAAMYPLGIALNNTGAAELVGNLLVSSLGGIGPIAVMGGIVLLTMALTQPIHNAAVAIIMTPIAINAAELMGSSPVAFSIAVLIACSTTFLLPYGHPAPYLVQVPGKYKKEDYYKFGFPMMFIGFAVIMGIIPLVWDI